MATCENSWAGRVVIGLQLLSWCAVGALLLHRGISSVKQEESPPSYSNVRTNFTEVITTNNTQFEKSTNVINPRTKVAEKSKSTVLTANLHPKLKISTNNLDKHENNSTKLSEEEVEESSVGSNVTDDSRKATPSSKTTPMITHNVRVPSSPGNTRKNLILTPSGVVMAALGAVMLILGPSIVILRCCDAGSRGRFSKLYADDPALALSALDRPPTYEEVADDAPRYSTLFPDEEDMTEDTHTTGATNAT